MRRNAALPSRKAADSRKARFRATKTKPQMYEPTMQMSPAWRQSGVPQKRRESEERLGPHSRNESDRCRPEGRRYRSAQAESLCHTKRRRAALRRRSGKPHSKKARSRRLRNGPRAFRVRGGSARFRRSLRTNRTRCVFFRCIRSRQRQERRAEGECNRDD